MNGNCGSQNNVYIGARYVPKIVGEWSADVAYEPLTVVLYQGTSYTSITYVPKGIIPSESTKQYWALTGNYNAQVEQYRQEVVRYKQEVDTLKPYISRTYSTTIDLISDNSVSSGLYVETLGYYNFNDGGGAIFKIEEQNDKIQIALNNNLFATLYYNNEINILQLGAEKNKDISTLLQSLIDNININKIFIPCLDAPFYLSKTININRSNLEILSNKNSDIRTPTLISLQANQEMDIMINANSNHIIFKNITISGNKLTNTIIKCVGGNYIFNDCSFISSKNYCCDFQIYMSTLNHLSYGYSTNGLWLHGITTGSFGIYTSVNMIDCYSVSCSNCGTIVQNMTYSVLSSCASDGCKISYILDGCRGLSFEACGCEHTQMPLILQGTNISCRGVSIKNFSVVSFDETTEYDSLIKLTNTVQTSIEGLFNNNIAARNYDLEITDLISAITLLDNIIPLTRIKNEIYNKNIYGVDFNYKYNLTCTGGLNTFDLDIPLYLNTRQPQVTLLYNTNYNNNYTLDIIQYYISENKLHIDVNASNESTYVILVNFITLQTN